MYKNVAVFLLAFGVCRALNLPSDFQKCSRSDPNVDVCLKRAVQAAFPAMINDFPQFNFRGIEPIRIPSLRIGEGKGSVHVVQHYKNVRMHNVYTVQVRNVRSEISDDKLHLVIDSFIENPHLEADYSLNGNILIFPIVGNGTCSINLRNVKVTLDIVGRTNGKKNLEITDFRVSLNPGKVEFDFRNLFNGDVQIGTEMNRLLNDNWRDVFSDVKEGYEEAFGLIFKNIANLLIKKVPYKDIFLM